MKSFLPLLAVPVVALALAGCGATDAPAPGPSASTTTTTTNTTADTTTHTATPRCHTGDLRLSLGQGEGAAGTGYRALLFTNKSGHRCTLYGYPGVSWVTGDRGTQVNEPFRREPGDKAVKVTLPPGGIAHAVLASADPGVFPADECKPVAVRGYRVYPPDETAAIFVPDPGTECSARGVGRGRVTVLAQGTEL
jgi:hypothetical protein